jgi:hypothetical protein
MITEQGNSNTSFEMLVDKRNSDVNSTYRIPELIPATATEIKSRKAVSMMTVTCMNVMYIKCVPSNGQHQVKLHCNESAFRESYHSSHMLPYISM